MAAEYFPLMKLPQEIRDMIYTEALCPTNIESGKEEKFLRVDNHGINTALLRTNRQIHNEATKVLLKNNLFVRVVCSGYVLRVLSTSVRIQVPVVYEDTIDSDPLSTDNHDKRHHKGFAMTHVVNFGTVSERHSPDQHYPPGYYRYLVILGRHFHLFCCALSMANLYCHPISQSIRHKVEIHELFLGTTTKQILTTKKQESLVAPYRKYFGLYENFNISGAISPLLAQQVVADVKKGLTTDPNAFMQSIDGVVTPDMHEDRLGAQEAQARIVSQLMLLNIRSNGSTWDKMKEETSEEFQHSLARKYCSAYSNLASYAQLNLVDKCIAGNTKTMSRESDQWLKSMSMVEQSFVPSFQLSQEQRLAQGCRIEATSACLGQDAHLALHFIERAQRLLPEDHGVQAVFDRIYKWTAQVDARNDAKAKSEDDESDVIIDRSRSRRKRRGRQSRRE